MDDNFDRFLIGNVRGLQGGKGDKGDTGDKGDQGEKGDTGDKGDTGPPSPASEIVPIDITGQAVDLNELISESKKMWNRRTYDISITNINAPSGLENYSCSVEFIPTAFLSSGNTLAHLRGGIQTYSISYDTGSNRRVYRRFYNYGVTPRWTPWVLDGTISTYINTITIEGTVAHINAELAKLPKLLNHSLTLSIVDGDYSTETLNLWNIVSTGNITIQTANTVSNINEAKKVKLKNIDLYGITCIVLTLRGIEFSEGDQTTIIPLRVRLNKANIMISYCDIGLSLTAIQSATINGISVEGNAGLTSIVSCRIKNMRIAINANSECYLALSQIDNCIYGVEAINGVAHIHNAQLPAITNTTYPLYRTRGIITNEVHTFKRWYSGDYTGVRKEFIFARINTYGTFRITTYGNGTGSVPTDSWEIYNGYTKIESKRTGAGYPGNWPSKVNLYTSQVSSSNMNILLKLECISLDIGSTTNRIYVTITPLHATDNDGFVVLAGQGESLPDTPTTWNRIKRAHSNPNLLHNWDFRNPVNQLGKSSYTGTSVVQTIDRWHHSSGAEATLEVVEGGVLFINNNTGANSWWHQIIENSHLFAGMQMTFSIEVVSGNFYVWVIAFNEQWGLSIPNRVLEKPFIYTNTFTLPDVVDPSKPLLVQPGGTGIVNTKISRMKLEVGNISTLEDDAPMDYGRELAICQRYRQIRSTDDVNPVDLRPSMYKTPVITQMEDDNYLYEATLLHP